MELESATGINGIYIKADGTTITTAKIPFARGAAFSSPYVSLYADLLAQDVDIDFYTNLDAFTLPPELTTSMRWGNSIYDIGTGTEKFFEIGNGGNDEIIRLNAGGIELGVNGGGRLFLAPPSGNASFSLVADKTSRIYTNATSGSTYAGDILITAGRNSSDSTKSGVVWIGPDGFTIPASIRGDYALAVSGPIYTSAVLGGKILKTNASTQAIEAAVAGTDYPGLASNNTWTGANTFNIATTTFGGAVSFNDHASFASGKQLRFISSGATISSSAAGTMSIGATTSITIDAPSVSFANPDVYFPEDGVIHFVDSSQLSISNPNVSLILGLGGGEDARWSGSSFYHNGMIADTYGTHLGQNYSYWSRPDLAVVNNDINIISWGNDNDFYFDGVPMRMRWDSGTSKVIFDDYNGNELQVGTYAKTDAANVFTQTQTMPKIVVSDTVGAANSTPFIVKNDSLSSGDGLKGLAINLNTAGRPTLIGLQADGGTNSFFEFRGRSGSGGSLFIDAEQTVWYNARSIGMLGNVFGATVPMLNMTSGDIAEVGPNYVANSSGWRTYPVKFYYGQNSSAGTANAGYLAFVRKNDGGGETEIGRWHSNGYLGVNNAAPAYHVDVGGDINTTGAYRYDGNTIIDTNGYVLPKSSTDAAAPNNSIYYSTTASKLVYKDSGGSVNALY